jgi:hypothetical protein
MGSSFDAFLAGYIPNNIPMIIQIINEETIAVNDQITGQPENNAILSDSISPKTTPSTPPSKEITKLSIKN